MTTNYDALRASHKEKYGTDIGRIGPMLLADRYAERTHFIFELLQNAEDALSRRVNWQGSRTVQFELVDNVLSVSHFGQPFNEADVRGVCGIAESTKQLTEIGRFGIGFKSVYAFTERPEVHSGDEAFAIESFVWPVAAPPITRDPEQTVFRLPLKGGRPDYNEIQAGLQRIGARSLLFLRSIDQIAWDVVGGPSGFYLRSIPTILAPCVRQVTVIGQQDGEDEVEEQWLIFDREVPASDGRVAGRVEIAFALAQLNDGGGLRVQPIDTSPLVVFFPTAIETHLGFLAQGPYRTTPSRDNVPRDDAWNQTLVEQTAELIVDIALPWMRDNGYLDTQLLLCLPLSRTRFSPGTLLAPLYDHVRDVLLNQPLLPSYPDGFIAGHQAKLSRGQELRDLFGFEQLPTVFDQPEAAWLSGDITQDRTRDLRLYLIQDLKVPEVTPELIIKLETPFFKAQSDAWVLSLYHFLASQPALARRLTDRPLIRLKDGSHVAAQSNGKPQAFLPGTAPTGFPTVREAVCATETARKFLASLGLTEPDPVDDVVYNVLPTYRENAIIVDDDHYRADIQRILAAFATDSKAKRQKLLTELETTRFVRAVDASDGAGRLALANETYLATDRLTELLAGIKGILFVDSSCESLRGEEIRELLEACGASRTLKPIGVVSDFSWEQRRKIRRDNGLEQATRENPISDVTLRGLDELLQRLPQLTLEERRRRTALLWEALADVESRRGLSAFQATYTWGYSQTTKTASFDAAYIRKLNTSPWVPDLAGDLQLPEFILFDSLGWKPQPFLESKIRFKPPVIEILAREAGIEPDVLDLLKQFKLTDVAALRSKLGIPDEQQKQTTADDVAAAITGLLGDTPDPVPPVPDPEGQNSASSGVGGSASGNSGSGGKTGFGGSGYGGGGSRGGSAGGSSHGGGGGTSGNGANHGGSRPFVSYLAASTEAEPPDPDGLDHAARMKLESQAIAFIREREPQLQQTQANNPGFDLFEPGPGGQPIRWVEVKASSVSFAERPATMSHTQLECAREHGGAYWLYVVERAGTLQARLIRIQNPAGKAKTFIFDQGWLQVAEVDTPAAVVKE